MQSEKTSENSGSATPDFKPYLDLVIKSADRTRSTIYILVLVMIVIFCTLRNAAFPGHMENRVANLVEAGDCIGRNDMSSASCNQALSYIKHFDIPLVKTNKKVNNKHLTTIKLSPTGKLVFEKQLDIFLQKRTDVHMLQLPIVGALVDSNDLWILSGFSLILILLVFWLCLLRERDNIERAISRASNQREKEWLIMAHVFSNPPVKDCESTLNRIMILIPRFIICFLPTALQLTSSWDDFQTLNIWGILEGEWVARVGFVAEIMSVGILCFLGIVCYRVWCEVNQIMKNLAVEVNGFFYGERC